MQNLLRCRCRRVVDLKLSTIAYKCVSIFRYCSWNTFLDDSGDGSDGRDFIENRALSVLNVLIFGRRVFFKPIIND